MLARLIILKELTFVETNWVKEQPKVDSRTVTINCVYAVWLLFVLIVPIRVTV